MRFSVLPAVVFGLTSVVHAFPIATPVEDGKFELINEVRNMVEARFADDEDFNNVIQKRDTEQTMEYVLDLVNSSGIIFDVLDFVAYSPLRIQKLANLTSSAVGNINTSALTSMGSSPAVSAITKALNISLIYNDVMDSGVVTSLLDGILLDESYRPVLVNLTTRVLGSQFSKNMFLYLVQDIFKALKRDEVDVQKRDTSSLENFVGNIVASALGSDLVRGIAGDLLTALNNTQILTTTLKTLIANEGYQNFTAQFVVDLIRTNITIDYQSVNLTKYADQLLSDPSTVLKLTSLLMSGQVDLSGAGKYADALKSIITDVEDEGVFANLNKYVFSESHTVTRPLVPTNDIVVAKTAGSNTKTLTTVTSSRTTAASNSTRSGSRTSGSAASGDSQSASEVASILSLLRGTISSVASSVESSVSSSRSSTSRRSVTATTSSFDFDALLSEMNASETETETETTATGNDSGLLALLAAISNSQNKAVVASTSTGSSSTSLLLSAANAAQPNNFVTKFLVYTQALLLGGVLLL
ncbi:CIC11C00000005528 [Sungouiella intermedia]|uniref:CIC11C00000005528 n=1 Tax=Sungouiella intermedia TaxID=45354 RepID=A0A1L0C0N8_9ASCO|nr:CIC11C00000005528 [[Candida] intermedia]